MEAVPDLGKLEFRKRTLACAQRTQLAADILEAPSPCCAGTACSRWG